MLFYSDSFTTVKVKNKKSERGCISRHKGGDKGGEGGAFSIVSYLFPMDVMDSYL